MDNYVIVEEWSSATEFEFADTIEEALKLRDETPVGATIYVKLGEQ